MTCKCISKERKDSLAKPEATNTAVRAMPELDVSRISFPKYEPSDVYQRVVELAKGVSVGNALDLAVLRSWLSAFYYYTGGCSLPVYHEPFHIEGLEDKSKDVNGVANDFSVPIEVPIFGPQEDDDWLSSSTVGSTDPQASSETWVLHKRKQRSVAEIMGENNTINPKSRKLASVEKSTTRKTKKDNNGDVKGGGSQQPSSTGEKVRKKRKGEVSGSPTVSNVKDDVTDGAKKIDIAASETGVESETVTTPRERKRSKYLSPPYTNLAWRLGNSSFKLESQVRNDKATKDVRENTADQEELSKEEQETPDTDFDTGLRAAKNNKKLSFPISDVDVPIDELLIEIQNAALDPFCLSKKDSLDKFWRFVSAIRSSTYMRGTDYKLYHKSRDENTPRASKKQRKSYRSEHSPSRSHSKVASPCKRSWTDDMVADLRSMKQKLEITTAILENYHSKFSAEQKSILKEDMDHLLEKMERVGDKIRAIAEKNSS